MSDPSGAPCERCPLGVTRAVASRGPVPARILMLSGAPRYHEEREGLAFASPAFSWLTETLAAVGIDPGTVHYATLTGCRPPRQRPLRDAEIEACSGRLGATIAALAPTVIVLCGSDALNAVLPGAALATAHGQVIVRGQRRYYPLRHPYAALHYERYVVEVEADLRGLAELLEAGNLPDVAGQDEAVIATGEPMREDVVTGAAPEPMHVGPLTMATLEPLSAHAATVATIPSGESDATTPDDAELEAAVAAQQAGAIPGLADDPGPATQSAVENDDQDAPSQLSLF